MDKILIKIILLISINFMRVNSFVESEEFTLYDAVDDAVYSKDYEFLKSLVKNKDFSNKLKILFIKFCRDNDTEAVKMLIYSNINVNCKDDNGNSALMHAAAQGHDKNVDILLNNCVDTSIANNNGWTAVNLATFGNHIKVVQTLMKHGDENQIKDLKLALDHATKMKYEEIKKYLQEMIANQSLYKKCVQKMLLNWSDLKFSTFKIPQSISYDLYKSGLDIKAQYPKNRTILFELKKRFGAQYYYDKSLTKLMHAILNNDKEKVKLIISQTPQELLKQDTFGDTALLLAIRHYPNLVKILFKVSNEIKKVAIEQANMVKWTPLIAATYHGRDKIVIKLLEEKVDVDCIDFWDMTALHYAITRNMDFIAKLLIDANANVHIENSSGQTAYKLMYKKQKKLKKSSKL